MKASSKSITDFLDGKNRSFLIPVYQRNYDWNAKEQCQVLWDDLRYIIEHGNNIPHFFGSIVTVLDADTGDYIVIDGQQRLTTISLLMLAIAHRSKEFQSVTAKNSASDIDLPDVDEALSLCVDYKKQQKLKLKLLRGDMEAYQCLVKQDRCPNYDKTHIVQNYKFFYSLLDVDNIKSIYNAVKQLIVVDIMLGKDDDNPQQVFESLNSKGLGLSDADKIRNFVLIGLPYEEQDILYKKYWEPMEELAGTSPEATTKYIWNFLAYKTNKKAQLSDIYNQFNNYKSAKMSAESILKDLLDMAEIYNHIKTQTYESSKINEKLRDIASLTEVTIPLFLDLFDKYEKKEISEVDVLQIMDIIEAYFVRRTVCRLKPAGTNKFFLINKSIHNLITQYDNSSYLDVFKYLIYTETGPMRFPTDAEVFTALRENDIYTIDRKTCKYILAKLEIAHNPNERVDVAPLTVEHIMPQTLNDEWKQELGDDYEVIHTKYLHTIGNLTLTGYNPEYGNRPFRFKKLVARGFDESPLYLNKFMKTTDVWTDKEIIQRANILIGDFMGLWHMYKPNNNYTYNRDIEKILLDNTDLDNQISGRKPKSFYLATMDKEIEVSSWKDLYYQIINLLYNEPENKKKMQRAFSFGNDGKFSGIISKTEEARGQRGEILWEQIIPGESIYFLMNKSSMALLHAIQVWLEYLNINVDDLEITLKSQQ